MLVTTARPTVFGIARRAWTSLFAAAASMTLLFIIGYGLMVGLDIAIDRMSHLLALPTDAVLRDLVKNNRRLPWLGVSEAFARDIAVCFLRAMIAAPLAVAMYRFILLGEVRRFYFLSRLSFKFAVWVVLLQVPVMVLSWLILFAGTATGLVPLLSVLGVAMLLLLMQTAQLFPAVAVQERTADTSARLETALERSEGMFWLTLISLVLTFLPLILVRAVVMRTGAKLAQHMPLVVPIGLATTGFVIVMLGSAVIAWLFSYGAHKKNAPQPAGQQPLSAT